MKIDTIILEDQQAKLTVEVDPVQLEDFKRRAARKLAGKVKIPGFRPGKAPYLVVLRHIGEGAVVEEALELLVDDLYPQIIKEADIKPSGPGSLESIVQMAPPILEFIVPLEAKVDLGDYLSLRRPYTPAPVTDEQVEISLKELQDSLAVLEPAERSAGRGDLVSLMLRAKRKNPVEGVNPVLIKERSLDVLIEPEDEEQERKALWPFPGFSQHLIGLSSGDERTFDYTYPENAGYETLGGLETEYWVKVEGVKSRTLPKLDDEFARSLGDGAEGGFASLEELRSEVRASLENQSRQAYNTTYDDETLEQAIEQAKFIYPPQMLEHEIDEVIENLQHRLEHNRQDINIYLKSRQMDMKGLREEAKPVAEKRLKKGLFLSELAKVHQLQVIPEELEAETVSTMKYLLRIMSKSEAKRLEKDDVRTNLVGNIMVDMLTRKAVDLLRDIASGKEVTLPTSTDEMAAEAKPAPKPSRKSTKKKVAETSAQ